jgi:hypothetical protein
MLQSIAITKVEGLEVKVPCPLRYRGQYSVPECLDGKQIAHSRQKA